MKVGTDAMLLGSLVSIANQPKTILDIGTGTGVIALMLTQRFRDAKVTGLEIDESACREAKFNFQNSIWKERVTAINGDILKVDFLEKFNLIVSNPPYYENSLLSKNERTSRAKHAEFLPIDFLLQTVSKLLAEDGSFWVIVPAENDSTWIENARKNDLHLQQSISIIGKEGQGEKRRILAFGQAESSIESSRLTVREVNNKYTSEYIELTKEFHDRDLSK
ncbi:MAG: methyltransferase [Crocinitomicaceae bacterium]|nr:methyltransferase [Flavobacteriales bacterium]NQZ35368.1 methyltransferase [Crocinitomicaceae bacterium]